MNKLIDLAILAVILFFALLGWYRGFLSSCVHAIAVPVSFFVSKTWYRRLARLLVNKYDVLKAVLQFTDAGEGIGDIELSRTVINAATDAQLEQAFKSCNFPKFMQKAITKNINNQVFSDMGLSTIEEYFNQTLGIIVLHIFCYVILFVIAYVVMELILGTITSAYHLPVLRHMDSLAGALVGTVVGCICVQVVFMLVSPAVTLMAMDQITEWFTSSSIGAIFYNSSAFLKHIKGTLLK